ncbi:4-amino-4-deoxy-L-arabinose transferase [Rhizobium sp. NFR07]|nr:4-amino-4-deoxy-L-arabinose transferase [Rhizobium sp. NFR07]
MHRLARFVSTGLRPAIIVLVAYFVLSAAVRIALPNGLTLDEAEQSFFSQFWLLGYGPQPPFYNWVQNAVDGLAGISLAALTLPKFTMLLLCYVFYGMAARQIDARPGFASLAMLSLLTLPQLSYMPQQDLTHTVAVLMATSLFLYGLFRALTRSDWQSFLIVGLAAGIGCISKYNFVLLPVATLLAIASDRHWRTRLIDPRLLLSVAVAAAVVMPHALWLISHVDLASSGTLSKMAASGAPNGFGRIMKAVLSLLLACIAFGGLSVAVLGLASRGHFKAALAGGDEWTRLLGRIMLFSLAGVVVVIISTGTTKITERWLDPYLLVLPLWLLLKFERAGADTRAALPRLLPVFAVIMVVTLLSVPGKTLLAGATGSYSRINQPMADMAAVLRGQAEPSLILADSQHLAGNMRLQFPRAEVHRLEDWQDALASPPAGPMLMIWGAGDDADVAPPAEIDAILQGRAATPSTAGRIEQPYLFSGGKRQFSLSYLWLGQ